MTARPAERPRRRVLFLRNPFSRRGNEQAELARQGLCRCGLEIAEEVAGGIGRFREAFERLQGQVDLVVIGGGDGTISAAAPALAGTGVPLGVLPMGTANDLARTLAIPLSLEDACAVLARGRAHDIDLGMVNGHYFFNAAGIGLSSRVTRQLTGARKRRWGALSYARMAFVAWRQSEPFSARLHTESEERFIYSLQLTVGNGRHYGGGMTVAEDAAIDDALLHVYSIQPVPLLRLVSLAPFLRRGSHDRFAAVEMLRTREIEVTTERPMPVNADGELVGHTPARFSVVPRALRVLVPPEYPQAERSPGTQPREGAGEGGDRAGGPTKERTHDLAEEMPEESIRCRAVRRR